MGQENSVIWEYNNGLTDQQGSHSGAGSHYKRRLAATPTNEETTYIGIASGLT